MSLKIIANTGTEVIADYVGRDKKVTSVRIKGTFNNPSEERTAVVEYLIMNKIISAGQYMGFISAIKSPRSKDFYSDMGKKGSGSRWGKK